MARILILGGTGEARALAAALDENPHIEVVSSLAGRTRDPRVPVGEVRVGGFGGADGLGKWLRANPVDAIVDATHPFAVRIAANAVEVAKRCGIPILVLRRPAWVRRAGDDWHEVADVGEAAQLLPQMRSRVFLTVGRQGVEAFAALSSLWFLIRAIDPPDAAMPARSALLLARGPFTEAAEAALMREHRIDVLVTKNSGGDQTRAKLDAARALGIPVVMVRRPPLPSGVPTVDDVAGALAWIGSRAHVPE
ncbi:cobalt-precorrin-6A reductase [Rhodococcus sp. WMMA185]|uniref:cobalt-precorrin-6A reductase n=1 Tax=Rhodococcus sp. WMMA185 TaxID=679318 RepID=UPI00087826C9|nr:cobalt-precorrin-6A reductase [Rhodococcus sp. WMMA185]AOW92693.1 cobalt-precorrin-6A reductase [Rhodococcus sp. WMMA185]